MRASTVSSTVSFAFLVLVLELSSGRLVLAGQDCAIPRAVWAVESFGEITPSQASASLVADRLPAHVRREFWVGRPVSVYECAPGETAFSSLRRVFRGIVAQEPGESAGIMSLEMTTPERQEILLPGDSPIDVSRYPEALEAALGQITPTIWGEVADCPLLPVKGVPVTTLRNGALPGDVSLVVADGTKLPQAGAVWLDDESVAYTSRTDTELLGVKVRHSHGAGTAVVAAGETRWLAAGHDCASITDIKGGGQVLTDAQAQADAVVFPRAPLADQPGAAMNVLLQFDRAASGAFAMRYDMAYPVADTLRDGTASYTLLGDLDVLLQPPASVASGSYTFSIDVAAQLRQDITNVAGAYQLQIGSQVVALPKTGGTVTVTVPVTSAAPIRVRHLVTAGGSPVDLSIALGLGSMPRQYVFTGLAAFSDIVPQVRSINVTWSQATLANVALNPTNAIRAVTATVTQNATGWDSSIASTGQGNILFARPNADRIVLGAYTVSFSVALNGYGGRVSVSIGGQTVYVADGGSVVYSWSPASLALDDDVDILPVKQEGGIGTAVVTITAASRTVGTGNLDGGKYATLRWATSNRKLSVIQTDDNPNRGTLRQAKLAIEWFGAGVIPANTVAVRWSGRLLGYLQAQTLTGSTVSKTVSVDVTSQGNSTLASSNISTVVTGGTAAMTHTAIAQKQTLQAALSYPFNVGGMLVRRGFTRVPVLTGWDSSLGSITVRFAVQDIGSMGNPGSSSDLFKTMKLRRSDGSDIVGMSTGSGSWTQVATDTWERIAVISEAPASVFWEELTAGSGYSLLSVSLEYNAKTTSGAASVSNTPASGGTTIPNGSLPNSGISLRTNNGDISVTIPDQPRTTVTEFVLADVTDWPNMTGNVAEIEMLSSCPDVHVVQIQLAVDYDVLARTTVSGVTAAVVGKSGNPADIIAELAAASGTILDVGSRRRFRDWCVANGYRFARRQADRVDALSLLNYATEQAHVELCDGPEGARLVRWFDVSARPIRVLDEHLMAPPELGWAERVENTITLKYRQDYVGDGFRAALVADPANNDYCRRSLRDYGRAVPVAIEAGWIADNATATRYLQDYARRYAPMRRVVTLSLPFIYAPIRKGDLLLWRRMWLRVTDSASDNGWLSVAAEQIID